MSMAKLTVELGSRSYPIFIDIPTKQLTADLSQYIRHDKVVVVSNPRVAGLYLDQLIHELEQYFQVASFLIPDGEQYKNLEVFNDLISFLLNNYYGRDTTLIALGGGVVGDLVGFVAACYQRGIDFIQYPTTLLAQVDSSVGGKTAINHPQGKNMIGAFYQPRAVMININTLHTLPDREFAAGLAEVVKYGIANDLEFFDWLCDNRLDIKRQDEQCLIKLITRCCAIKADIVRRDEKEGGVRALLNFGHTFGHAIEAHMGYGQWLHGEAVAAGMVYASRLAQELGFLTVEEVNRIIDWLEYFDLPIKGPIEMSFNDYMIHMKRDKKNLDGCLRFVIPIALGEAKVISTVTPAQLQLLLDKR